MTPCLLKMTALLKNALLVLAIAILGPSSCQSFTIVPTTLYISNYGALRINQRKGEAAAKTSLRASRSTPAGTTRQEEQAAIQTLLTEARRIGQVGSLASTEDQEKLVALAQELSSTEEIADPARVTLAGVHSLVYSASPGGSSGRLVGPIYGRVQQTFLSDNEFVNSVQLGPLRIALRATCEIKDDVTNIVKFKETIVSLFGLEVARKQVGGGGVWKYLYMGEVEEADGSSKLIRVMETPSLFILEQDAESRRVQE